MFPFSVFCFHNFAFQSLQSVKFQRRQRDSLLSAVISIALKLTFPQDYKVMNPITKLFAFLLLFASQFPVARWRCAFVPQIHVRAQSAARSIARHTHCAPISRTSTPSAPDIVACCAAPWPSRATRCIRICRVSIAASPPRTCPCCPCQAPLIRISPRGCWPRPE